MLDNVVGPFGHPTLDQVLTSTSWSDRVLGSYQMFEGPLQLTWFATGNNCQLRGDLDRRVAHVRLESPEQRPELRTGFRHPDLLEHVRANRAAYLTDALTFLRGWHVAGRTTAGLAGWGSFGGWSRVVRATLVWAGLTDPADTREELVTHGSTERALVESLYEHIARIDPTMKGWTAAELVNTAGKDGALKGVLDEWLREASPRTLGYKLKYLKRQRFSDGRYLDHLTSGSAGVRWALRRPEGPPSSEPTCPVEAGDAGDPPAAMDRTV